MNFTLKAVIDIQALNSLFESFTNITGIASALLDLNGTILIATGWKDICTQYHRIHPVTSERCRESDTVLASQLKMGQKYNIYQCKNGMVDVAVPIVINDVHVGNLFIGQFFFKPPDIDFFRRQAADFGFDESAYLKALSQVPIFSEEQIMQFLNFLTKTAVLIGDMGVTRLKLLETNYELEKHRASLEEMVADRTRTLELTNRNLQNEIEQRKTMEDELRKMRDDLELRVQERTAELARVNQNLLSEIRERTRTQNALLLDESRLETLLELNEMSDAAITTLTDYVLEKAVQLTGSTIGYLAFTNEDESILTMYSWSHEAMAECRIPEKPHIYNVNDTGLWGEAIRQRRPIITNDYAAPNPWKKGYPAGHGCTEK